MTIQNLSNPPGFLGNVSSSPSVVPLPMLEARIPCGFPSPAEDHVDDDLDLNELCIRNPPATFFVRADSGDSMIGNGIESGDVLVVDRSLDAKDGDLVIAMWDGAYTLKQLRIRGRSVSLVASNPRYQPIVLPDGAELSIWGVVTWCVKSLSRRNR